MSQTRFTFDNETKFEDYHRDNPDVYEALKKFALQAKRSGRTRLGIAMLYERVRWFTTIETSGTFKVGNTWRAYYARKLMKEEPELAGFFETRKSKADKEI